MSIQTKEYLKTRFETGDKPSQQDFIDLLDTLNDNPMTAAGDIIIGGTSGAPTRLAKGDDDEVLTLVNGVPAWAAASGGSAAIDWANPVSVTTTANLTIGKHHVCSGTSADYTVTLPAVSGNAGKLLSIEMSGALTKLVTVDGNGSETIDGATTRVMWARETAVLLCDGTQWTKIGGKSVPMSARMSITTTNSVSIANQATVKVLLDKNALDSAGMVSTANNRINIRRPGIYSTSGAAIFQSLTTSTLFELNIYVNGAPRTAFAMYGTGSNQSYPSALTPVANISLTSGDYIELYIYHTSGVARNLYTDSTGYYTYLSVTEVLTW